MFFHKKKLLFSAILLLIFGYSFSQNPKRDIIQKLESMEDSIRYLIRKNNARALKLSNDYIKLCSSLKENKNEKLSKGYYLRATCYTHSKNYENAINNINHSIKFSKKNSEHIIESYLLKGVIISYRDNWRNNKTIENYQIALNIAKENNYFLWEQTALARIASFYSLSGEIRKSIEIQKKIIKNIKLYSNLSPDYLRKHRLSIRNTYNYITKNLLWLEQVDSAKVYNERFYEELQKDTLNYNLWTKIYHENDLYISLLNSNVKLAEENYKKLNSIYLPNYSRENVIKADSLYYLGWIYYLKKDYNNAAKTLELMKSYSSHNSNFLYKNYFRFLLKSYIKMGDKKNANKHFDLLIESIENNKSLQDSFKIKLKKIETEDFNKELKTLQYKNQRQKRLIIIITMLLLIAFFGFYLNRRKLNKKNKLKFEALNEKLRIAKTQPKISLSKTSKSIKIKKTEIQRIIENLKKLEHKHFYLKQNCSLVTTARAIKTNTSYLSKTVNATFKKTFNDYINELRINHALEKLKEDSQFRKYTIQSIANDIGFKSKESFNKAFKKQTGILPSYYIKQIEKFSDSGIN